MPDNYYSTKKSVEEYIKMAEGYNGKGLIDKLKKFLPSQATLLEIGSGPGTDLEILKKDFIVTGSDLSKEFLKYLNTRMPRVEFLELNAVTLLTDKTFDGIYSNKVLHHLSDSELSTSIKRQYETLTPGGIICHSFWKGEGSEYYNKMLVNYLNSKKIERLLKNYFDIHLLESYTEFENNDSLLVIAKKSH